MKKLRVSMYDLVSMLPSQVNDYVRTKLEDEGFDMSKPIVSDEDLFMQDIVFKQNTEGIDGSGSQ